MISFQQSIDSFVVDEAILYEPCGSGAHCFARIRKRGLSTMQAKRKISEMTGVPMREIRHAGLKDTYATASQWLSWPKKRMRQEPVSNESLEILELTHHTNGLSVGQVFHNSFELRLEGDGPIPSLDDLRKSFPNFYGRQRFGQTYEPVAELMKEAVDKRSRISHAQSRLFNDYLRGRLKEHGRAVFDDELWTHSNGKRVFETPLDETIHTRYEAMEITPTGPIYGYKVNHRQDELAFLSQHDLEPESFRPWGKSMKGARRPLFVEPKNVSVQVEEGQARLCLTLPSGAYATVFLIHAFQTEILMDTEENWPDFTEVVTLGA